MFYDFLEQYFYVLKISQLKIFLLFLYLIIIRTVTTLLQNKIQQKMKNFEQILAEPEDAHQKKVQVPMMGRLKQQTYLDQVKKVAVKVIAPLALAIATGPFNTVSALLQITQKPLFNPIEAKLKNITPENPIYKHIKNGIFGNNKIYKAFQFRGYQDALKQLGKQGFRGIYKGNLTGLIYYSINTKLRTELYSKTSQKILSEEEKEKRNFLKENLITIGTCTLADLVTLPLLFCQSRLVLQNSISNFRVYKSPIDVVKSAGLKALFTGSSLLLFKNTMFSLAWLQLIQDSPAYSFILSSFLSHIVTYPFITIIRQMQTNSPKTMMMHDRQENLRESISRIWNNQGIRGFYRGFIGYGLVHMFMGILMIEQTMRTGYFDQIQ